MNKISLTFILLLFIPFTLYAQETNVLKGVVIDYKTQKPLSNITINIIGLNNSQLTNVEGRFVLQNFPSGNYFVKISHTDYETQRYSITINKGEIIDFGIIYLYADDFIFNDMDQLVWSDDNSYDKNQTYYSTSNDVFLKAVGFEFSSTFFSIRGYDAGQSKILMNGVDMSSLYNNRTNWSFFSGLNEVTRIRQSTIGLSYSNKDFGGLTGLTNISTIASEMQPGLRITSSFSNKNYVGSIMTTYNSGLQENGFAYSISASRRWGNEGYIEATLYDAISLFGGLSYNFNEKHSLNATAMYSPSRKGQSIAITERVFNKFGSRYNPYWGWQEGEKRNSNISQIKAPIFMFGHQFKNEKSALSTNLSYQSVNQKNSRLDYIDAPNPYPNYWKYLPEITENPQIDWLNLYETNLNVANIPDGGSARYLIYEHIKNDNIFTINSVLNQYLNVNLNLDTGISYKTSNSNHFASPNDLLGATFYNDVNPFSLIDGKASKNDLLGDENKGITDKIKYYYNLNASQLSAFAQLHFQYNRTDFFIATNYTSTSFQRDGKFLNQSYESNSLGKSKALTFNDFGLKVGLDYNIQSEHRVQLNTAFLSQAPTIQNSFINIRENNMVVPNLVSDKIIAVDVSYLINTSKLQSRLTGYFTDFKDGTTVNSFFAEIGSGADYFQEVVTHINKRHLGLELGLAYEITPNLRGSAIVAHGQHTYTKNANVGVNFDTAEFSEDIINNTGFIDLGETYLKNFKLANGPQQAYSIGLFYKKNKKWWLNASGNYFSNVYLDISAITRTDDFFNDPNNFGQPFQDIDFDLARKLLKQEKFDNYAIVNLSAGKLWQFKKINLKLTASIQNLFDINYKTGGYEQSRTANYKSLITDASNGTDQRNFGPKYWYGFGRTFFIKLAFSFKKYKHYEDNK